MDVISLFSGCGGLDLGFKQVGFNIVWANEFDRYIHETFETNFPETTLDKRSIRDIPSEDIPACIGMIGGPPCQSWSEAGALRGIEDERGQLFYEFIRVLRAKKPLFFLAENVEGMLAPRHAEALENIKDLFRKSGYNLSFKLLNAKDYGVPQDRKRVFFIGYREDLNMTFEFPEPIKERETLFDAIYDLRTLAVPQGCPEKYPNHSYHTGGFSSIYMSRNRVRAWHEPAFTVQASARHTAIHPDSPKMIKVDRDRFDFANEDYRRLTVRECARIQTFPDSFKFLYKDINTGYKMIGNAVPVKLAKVLASKIQEDIKVLEEDKCLQ